MYLETYEKCLKSYTSKAGIPLYHCYEVISSKTLWSNTTFLFMIMINNFENLVLCNNFENKNNPCLYLSAATKYIKYMQII